MSVVTPAPRDDWQTLMLSDPEAVPYQSPGWMESVCASGTFQDVSRLYTMPDGRRFLLPLARRSGRPSWLAAAASLPPSWGMGGVIGDTAPSVDDLRLIAADIALLPYLQTRIRPNPRLGSLWDAAVPPSVMRVERVCHVLDLTGGFDHLWSNCFTGNARNKVRKAERDGVVVERDSTGRLLPIFHQLLELSFDRWAAKQNEPRILTRLRGSARDPLEKFKQIGTHMGEACHVWVAWVNGVPAAAIVILQYGNVNDTRAAMDRDAVGTTGANNLLQKLAIEEACRAGCRFYHLGETGNSKSLAHFKESFGAVAVRYHEYNFERLPISRLDRGARRAVKRVIGFKDA
ncbi:MAG: GNAT family N-acetyltransferase [Devosia sp.]